MNSLLYLFYHIYTSLLQIRKNHPTPILSSLILIIMSLFFYFLDVLLILGKLGSSIAIPQMNKYIFSFIIIAACLSISFYIIKMKGYTIDKIKDRYRNETRNEYVIGVIMSYGQFVVALAIFMGIIATGIKWRI